MSLRFLDAISFAICLVSIVAGAVLSMVMIWGEIPHYNELFWKSLLTTVTFFVAAALTLAASHTFARRGKP